MTEELRRRLRAAAGETLALVATAAGQPLYERMGFRIATHYRQMEGDHLAAAPEAPDGSRLRPMTPGRSDSRPRARPARHREDRRDVLTELAAVGGWVLEDTAGPAAGLRGFLLRRIERTRQSSRPGSATGFACLSFTATWRARWPRARRNPRRAPCRLARARGSRLAPHLARAEDAGWSRRSLAPDLDLGPDQLRHGLKRGPG